MKFIFKYLLRKSIFFFSFTLYLLRVNIFSSSKSLNRNNSTTLLLPYNTWDCTLLFKAFSLTLPNSRILYPGSSSRLSNSTIYKHIADASSSNSLASTFQSDVQTIYEYINNSVSSLFGQYSSIVAFGFLDDIFKRIKPEIFYYGFDSNSLSRILKEFSINNEFLDLLSCYDSLVIGDSAYLSHRLSGHFVLPTENHYQFSILTVHIEKLVQFVHFLKLMLHPFRYLRIALTFSQHLMLLYVTHRKDIKVKLMT